MILGYKGSTPQARLNDNRRWQAEVRQTSEPECEEKWECDKYELLSSLVSDEKELEEEARARRYDLPWRQMWFVATDWHGDNIRKLLSETIEEVKDIEAMSDYRVRKRYSEGKNVVLAKYANDMGYLREAVDELDEQARERASWWTAPLYQ